MSAANADGLDYARTAPPVEVRAVWVDANAIPKNPDGIRKLVRTYHDANINVLFPETIARGYAIYESNLLAGPSCRNRHYEVFLRAALPPMDTATAAGPHGTAGVADYLRGLILPDVTESGTLTTKVPPIRPEETGIPGAPPYPGAPPEPEMPFPLPGPEDLWKKLFPRGIPQAPR